MSEKEIDLEQGDAVSYQAIQGTSYGTVLAENGPGQYQLTNGAVIDVEDIVEVL